MQRIGTTLDYAHIKGHIPQEITLRSVTRGLPRADTAVKHMPALPYEQVPSFMTQLITLETSVGRDALKLTV